jgi:hypothetical protein
MGTLLHDENEILLFTDTDIKPFSYDIEAEVSSEYDDFRPRALYKMKLTVDPSSKAPTISEVIDVDNHHYNCRHYHGHLHAKYSRAYETSSGQKERAKIEFSCWWDRTCGQTGWTNKIVYAGSEKNGTAQLDYDRTVRVNIKFKIV